MKEEFCYLLSDKNFFENFNFNDNKAIISSINLNYCELCGINKEIVKIRKEYLEKLMRSIYCKRVLNIDKNCFRAIQLSPFILNEYCKKYSIIKKKIIESNELLLFSRNSEV